jgi:NADH-quinone oxidoreductase subunit J
MNIVDLGITLNCIFAIICGLLTFINSNLVHSLLYFIITLVSIAFSLYYLGAPMAAALQVIIYAGAIMVVFIFVVMLLYDKKEQLNFKSSFLPLFFVSLILGELYIIIVYGYSPTAIFNFISPKQIALALFNEYYIAIELVSFLLLASLISACILTKDDYLP